MFYNALMTAFILAPFISITINESEALEAGVINKIEELDAIYL